MSSPSSYLPDLAVGSSVRDGWIVLAPAALLLSTLSLQFVVYTLGFSVFPRAEVVSFFVTSASVWLLGYAAAAIVLRRSGWRLRARPHDNAGAIASAIGIIAVAAVLVGAFRMYLNRDVIFIEFGQARFWLEGRRHGVTAIGIANAFLAGAPFAYAIYAAVRCRAAALDCHRGLSLLLIALSSLLLGMEGGRLSIVIGMLHLVATIGLVSIIDRQILVGRRYALALIAIVALFATYSALLVGARERLTARTSADQTAAHFEAIVRGGPAPAPPQAAPAPPAMQDAGAPAPPAPENPPSGIRSGAESGGAPSEPPKSSPSVTPGSAGVEKPVQSRDAPDEPAQAAHRALDPEGLLAPLSRWLRTKQALVVATFYVAHPVAVVDRILGLNVERRSYGALTFWSINKVLEATGLPFVRWADIASHYGNNGQYHGLFGLSLMEFGYGGGFLAIGLWGAFAGLVLGATRRPGGTATSAGLIVSYAVIVPLLAPWLDVLSTAIGQSLAIWLALLVIAEAFLTRSRPRTLPPTPPRP